jgi:hypothetical protein
MRYAPRPQFAAPSSLAEEFLPKRMSQLKHMLGLTKMRRGLRHEGQVCGSLYRTDPTRVSLCCLTVFCSASRVYGILGGVLLIGAGLGLGGIGAARLGTLNKGISGGGAKWLTISPAKPGFVLGFGFHISRTVLSIPSANR